MEPIAVSVVVITYNSAAFVLETLESIRQQNYKNIELVISDDFSTDDTLTIVKEWVIKNSSRFFRTVIVEAEKNTGVSANANRALYACTGRYVKLIAGDDLLLPNCIVDNVSHAEENATQFLFSKCVVFDNNDPCKTEILKYSRKQDKSNLLYLRDAKQQFEYLLRSNFVMAPSNFICRKSLIDAGGYDERFRIEDYPLWLKLTHRGIKLNYMDKKTVMYRINNSSSVSRGDVYIKEFYFNEMFAIYQLLRRPYLTWAERADEDLRFSILERVLRGRNTKRQYRKLSILRLLTPSFYLAKLKELFI